MHPQIEKPDVATPDLMSLEEYQARTGEGWTKIREAARANKLLVPVLRSGRRYFVSRRAFERLLEQQHGEAIGAA